MAGPKGNKKKKKAVPLKPSDILHTPSSAIPNASPSTAVSASAVPPPKLALSPPSTSPGLSAASLSRGASKPALDTAALLQRAQKLKEEGNRQFADKRFSDAFRVYEVALKFIPEGHTERSVLYSNRAACLLHMKPVDYEGVVKECNLALELQPDFHRALFRRARAYLALGRSKEAEEDLLLVLKADVRNQDALELLEKVKGQAVVKEGKEVAADNGELEAVDGGRGVPLPLNATQKPADGKTEKSGAEEEEDGQQAGQQIVLDDWFLELAEMIRMRLGIDPTRSDQLDLSFAEVNRAIDETVSTEEASKLLQVAETKFMNMSAMVQMNWASAHRALSQKKSARNKKKGEEEKVIVDESVKKDEEAEGAAKEESEGETPNGIEEKESEQSVEAGGEKEETSAEELSDLDLELADCDWALKHLEIAMQKYDAALKLQPGMVDALAGLAHCLAEKASMAEKRSELLATKSDGSSVTRELITRLQQDYEAACEKFVAAKEVLNKIENDFLELPKNHHHCNNPEHNHGTPEEGGGGEAHEEDPQFLENVKNFRQQMYAQWFNALSSSARFEYKLGKAEWTKNLKLAVALRKEMGETEEDIVKFFASFGIPVNGLEAVVSGKEEGAPETGGKGEEEGKEKEAVEATIWSKAWAQEEEGESEGVAKSEEIAAVPEEKVEESKNKEEESKEEESKEEESKEEESKEIESGVDDKPITNNPYKKASASAGKWKETGGNAKKEGSRAPASHKPSSDESGRAVEKKEKEREEKKGAGSAKKGNAEDEPMTPVKDLVGKFASLIT